ncbi:hypothetical protein K457DRAFT_595246 [Linnemannia elongata AG-77]|uniref:Uncharacterized protein n=1 Tax=Linnemannia elongata AG-77 TaxID=1314771 RepID=A0A197JUN3_9FUNG|nr:hypothetical protein K457DRAFT_595246 [Linnemannia elongata AG-77]
MTSKDLQRQGNSHDSSHPTASEVINSDHDEDQYKTRGAHSPSEHVSLKTWIRNAPWSQYFKDGCRLIVQSPFNFFVFFCCLSVVVWGAFLVLLMGNMVKLKDDATQKLWIEIASQVLNGFFTLANVPVNPKRFGRGQSQGHVPWILRGVCLLIDLECLVVIQWLVHFTLLSAWTVRIPSLILDLHHPQQQLQRYHQRHCPQV